ncbi:ammonia-dependent NAD(+) synthetase [Exiguobacterium sp. AM39-5BH]|uniref:ammonia-dependent NAD(+) synthetase n=1 Tax=Exiguobacterium sp. AM39-5BH TaxID=2292355 RepID=UPI000FE22C56|nr:ammonia-dependent NAD(+) synthetase [Exiguobacterium sp. AM39-5BH]RHB50630.1 ammonia-dependent NAD(+) synthetase [Exiguobacterium sp. AM39-5BH]
MQQHIIESTHAKPFINPAEEIRRRIDFLKSYVKRAGAKGLVLGISGGQDSTLAGKLCQLAMEELREETSTEYTFYAIRLPYGEQQDEADAKRALEFIRPDQTFFVNVKPAVDASVKAFEQATGLELGDFHKGNTKARERMKVQYDVAATFGALVVGTDHAAEYVTGFYTKHGDGAADVTPLTGLNKRQGKALLQELGAPESLIYKVPTADLEDDKPGLPDEVALGMTYNQLDDYLEGKDIDPAIAERIETIYKRSRHKHHMPASLYDEWWQ